MGDGEKASLRLQFDPQIRLEFHGAAITSDAGFGDRVGQPMLQVVG